MYWLLIFSAALLEFWGDALIRKGVTGWGFVSIAIGFVMLGAYGLVVNLIAAPDWIRENFGLDISAWLNVKIDFAELLGVYVAAFAFVSVVCSSMFIDHKLPTKTTLLGLILLIVGGLIIQSGVPTTR